MANHDEKIVKSLDGVKKAVEDSAKDNADREQARTSLFDSIKNSFSQIAEEGKQNRLKETENRREQSREQSDLMKAISGIGKDFAEFGSQLKNSISDFGKVGFIKDLALGAVAFAGGVLAFGEKFANIIYTSLIPPLFNFFSTSVRAGFLDKIETFKKSERFTKIAKFFETIRNFFTGLTSKTGLIGRISSFFAGVGKILKPFFTVSFKVLEVVGKIFRPLLKILPRILSVVGKFFLPLTIVLGLFDTISGAIEGFQTAEGGLVEKIKGAVSGAVAGLLKFFTFGLIDFDYLKGITDGLVNIVAAPFELIGDVFSDIMAIFRGEKSILEGIGDLAETIVMYPVKLFSSIVDTVGSIFGVDNLGDGILGLFDKVKDFFTDLFTSPLDLISNIPLPKFDIPFLQEGGIVRGSRSGTLATIAESNTSEAVLPLETFGSQFLEPSLDRILNQYLGANSPIGTSLNKLASENAMAMQGAPVTVVAPQINNNNVGSGGGSRVPIIASVPARVQDTTVTSLLSGSKDPTL